MAAGEPAAEVADTAAVQRYEQLRRQALDGQPGGARLGLAVLQREGVAAWMAAWSDLGAVVAPESPPPSPTTADAVVAVLASMALACAAAG